jgi:hypothetical protein
VNKFLANLTPSQKKIFYVAVFFVVIALFDRLLVGPTMAKLSAIGQAIECEENSIKGDLRFLAYKDRINKESKTFEPYYAKETPREDEVMAKFLENLDKIVSQSGLVLLKNNRSNDQKDPSQESKDYFVYKADLEASGSLDDIAKLMYTINTSSDLMKILKVNLAMKKTGDVEEMKASMVVAKYIVRAASSPAQPSETKSSAAKPAK